MHEDTQDTGNQQRHGFDSERNGSEPKQPRSFRPSHRGDPVSWKFNRLGDFLARANLAVSASLADE